MNRVCTISEDDLQQLERLNKALAIAPEGKEWREQQALLLFIQSHPTLLPYCIQAGREKKAAKAESERFGTFQSLHAGGRK